ncbi:hypothetical protein DY000_02055781 [Brassica cretica]|uniref:Protein kinase domain-containing protein n=1 Tax=Brassica cretica TaxID=69181 RepID=A0ABQ7AIU7_BRACR|nr:hypothetical protein DY000_02055781 [Brassica cretica]
MISWSPKSGLKLIEPKSERSLLNYMMGFASGRSLLELESPYEVGSNFTSSSVQQPQDLGKLWSFFHEVVDVTKGPPTIPNSQLEKVAKKTRTGSDAKKRYLFPPATEKHGTEILLVATTHLILIYSYGPELRRERQQVRALCPRRARRRKASSLRAFRFGELAIHPEACYLVTSLSLHPFACKDCKKAQDLLPTKLELISATKVISSFRLDQVSLMVASCRLDTLRVANEFQDELSGSEAWFLHSNSRDKLTPAIVEPKTSGCHHHVLMLRKAALSYELVGSGTSGTSQNVSQHHYSLTSIQANNFLGTHDLGTRLRSSILHSQPKSTVGTPAYIAPGILLRQEYDGKDLNLSPECRHLISRILVADRATIISIPDIKFHEWFLKNPPRDLMDENRMNG